MDKQELQAAEILVELALAEDVAGGDITTDNLIPEGEIRNAVMVAKSEGVIAGLPVAEMVFRKLDKNLKWNPKIIEGEAVKYGDIIVSFSATYRALLTGERTALNFLQRMSGIATTASKYTAETVGYKTKILDTRKTLPGFRLLDKYAVKTGGAANHRIGLFDMAMIKDNHIKVTGSITRAVNEVRPNIRAGIKIEVETTTLAEVAEAIEAGADIIMLDNMDCKTMAEAVKIIKGKALVEASGNMDIHRIKEVASTGVDFISVGALTHSVVAFDISQKITD